MDQTEEALENLNRVFEQKIASIDDDNPTFDEGSKSKLKIELLEQWKDSLIKNTKKCMETIVSSTRVLDNSVTDSSDDASKASKVSKSRANESQDYRNFTQQVAALKKIIMEMGSRSRQALIELSRIAESFERQLHLNTSLSQENSSLKSSLETMYSKTSYYNQLADKILNSMKEESVDLKRFFAEYEKRMLSIEKNSSRSDEEMTRRLKTLENELASKNRRINELTDSLHRFDKPSATSTMIDSPIVHGSPKIPARINSSQGSENNIDLTLHESYEISLTDAEVSDDSKIRTLVDGARTMAQLLKEKQKFLRKQKAEIEKSRATTERLQTKLNDIQVENTRITVECERLRSKSEHYDQLSDQMLTMSSEKKQQEEILVRTISAQEEQIEKLIDERKRLTQSNYEFFNSISVAYKELGNCIEKTVK